MLDGEPVISTSSYSAVVIMVINTLMVMVVVTPVNIGTFQLACVFALSLFSIERPTALSFSIVLHAFNYIPLAVFAAGGFEFQKAISGTGREGGCRHRAGKCSDRYPGAEIDSIYFIYK